jgi:RNA recognition motif-containing protein
MSVRLFVGNLPYDATEDEIRAHFSTAGNVSNVFVPVDRETGKKRGFAFVEFNDAAAAQEAIRLFNSQPFKGRPLAVNEARAKESRPAGAAPGGGSYRPASPRPMGAPSPRPYTPRPSGDSGFSRPDSGMDAPSTRGDRPNRKFGPDAKPFKNRSQKPFKAEGGKKAFKEKVGGQLHSMDDDDVDPLKEAEIDDFATSLDDQDDGGNE